MSQYELSFGSPIGGTVRMEFDPAYLNDAVFRFSEVVLRLNASKEHSAWVALRLLPNMPFLAWTKTSNERPTMMGRLTSTSGTDQGPAEPTYKAGVYDFHEHPKAPEAP